MPSQEGKVVAREQRVETVLQHSGNQHRIGKGLISATEQSVTFRVESTEDEPVYQRLSNTSNNKELQSVLADLQHSEGAFVTNSGMAALYLILATELRPGDHIVCQENCYGSTKGLLDKVLKDWGVRASFCSVQDLANHLQPTTRAIIVESISNPFCVPQDVAAACALAQSRGIVSIVDNTFASPWNCKPLTLGADYTFESATKYLNGHSDQVAGVIGASSARIQAIASRAMYLGCFLASDSCVKLLRGLRTFALRMQRHNENGTGFANAMRLLPQVERVYYGVQQVDAHSGTSYEDRIREIFGGFGGMVCLRFRRDIDVPKMLSRCRFVADVPSLGGTETTACIPLHTTHKWTEAEECKRLGVDEFVLRVSVGLESLDDIVADFRQAMLASAGP